MKFIKKHIIKITIMMILCVTIFLIIGFCETYNVQSPSDGIDKFYRMITNQPIYYGWDDDSIHGKGTDW